MLRFLEPFSCLVKGGRWNLWRCEDLLLHGHLIDVWRKVETSLTCRVMPTDQWDADLEVSVEVVLEVLDFHWGGGILELPLPGLPLGGPGGTPPPAGLFPGPLFPQGALLARLFGFPPPDPSPLLLDPSGGPPRGDLGFAPKGVH